MRVTGPAKAFATALTLAEQATRDGKRSALCHLDAGARMMATASNSLISIEVPTVATVAEPGRVAVSASHLAELLAAIPADAAVELASDHRGLAISAGRGKWKLQAGIDPPDAPELGEIRAAIEISAEDLARLIEPLPAVGDDDRTYLSGLCWRSGDGALTSTATDSVLLLQTSIAAAHFSDSAKLIIPRETAAALRRLIRTAKPGKVTLRQGRRLIGVRCPAFNLVSRLVDASFPDTAHMTAIRSANAATVRRADLIGALDRLRAAATAPAMGIVGLQFGAGAVRLWLLRAELGDDVIDATTDGAGQIALSLSRLRELLDEFPGDPVRLEISASALVIRGAHKLGLLMSVRWPFEAETPAMPDGAGSAGSRNAPSKTMETIQWT